MKYQIIGKNIEVTEGIKEAVENKLSRLDKYFVINEDVTCRVVVRSYKVGAKIEVTIFTPYMDFRAEVTNDDLYAGVDLAIDKLEGQMRKLKTRMDRSRGGKLSLGKALALESIEELPIPEDEDDTIVRTKSIGHPFFLYLDEDDDKISVVYQRDDGGYGIFQAEDELR